MSNRNLFVTGYANGIAGVDHGCEDAPFFLKAKHQEIFQNIAARWYSIAESQIRVVADNTISRSLISEIMGSSNLGNLAHKYEEALLADYLNDNQLSESHPTNSEKIASVASACRVLADTTKEIVLRGGHVINFGGDHACAIGTWSGIKAALPDKKIGLIWIDAHMDAHTFETTETGNIHGMPVAALLGHGDPLLTNIGTSSSKIDPANMVLIGIRSYENGEEQLLKSLGVRVYYMDEVEKRGIKPIMDEVIAKMEAETDYYGISIDLDGFDPKYIKAVGTPVKRGVDLPEFLDSLPKLAKSKKFIASEIVEYNPHMDEGLESFDYIGKIVQCLYKEGK